MSLLPDWRYAVSMPAVQGQLKVSPEDFVVIEELGFEPEGQGEHLYVWVEKRELNTDDAARVLAKWLKLPLRAVSYSGMKDRNARTSQWFSLHLPGKSMPDIAGFQHENMRILRCVRHSRKLKRGMHLRNHFEIHLHQLRGEVGSLAERLQRIGLEGVPNYFGEQRFGREGYNLQMVERLFAGELDRLSPYKRGLFLSTARSFIFNQVLSERIAAGSWTTLLSGEAVYDQANNTVSIVEQVSEGLLSACAMGQVGPTGPLWGKGYGCRSVCESFEQDVISPWLAWCTGLESFGLHHERRALQLRPVNVQSDLRDDRLSLSFSLPRGGFATSVIRELCVVHAQSDAG
ncbi:tRNA pseudouridine(13) synthase TruD [Pokkaliibacter sp. MBI-7]|uniref:tRNA pseudouridine(13) synthase TruD n=1 Tax=Pokkaliibacter sp. MBI-7 TaxID=3040600 RepID=UPI0024490137|nr:tRNA pseudouridine(13) synthase TruD [Pokkaliibacter sp. MBI-7]MDH2434577.1 tRNA pseudouridine(13) synthase TruD [Pokkaliibacter sp. MBI-7]